jgi:dipeptidyl aminopeptidase/acylaminoacyl peptidase
MANDTAQPLLPADLYRFRWVSDPRLSPDGTRVAYVLTTPEDRGKKYRSEIWIAPAIPTEPVRSPGALGGKRFTSGPRDRAPRWSPDGRTLAFVSDRGGESQIWLIRTDGGEAAQLTRQPGGTGDPVWSPDGRTITYVAGAPLEESARPGVGHGTGAPKSDVRVFSRLKYKANGKGLWNGNFAQVFAVSVPDGEARQVTAGPYDCSAPAWSPDSKLLAFSSNRAQDPDRTPSSDIWVVPAAGGEPRKLTRSEGPAELPSWSPDGRLVAFYGHRNQCRGATNTHIHVVSADTPGETADILGGWDGSAGVDVGSDMMSSSTPPPHWSPDGAWIYFVASARGAADLYRVRLPVYGEAEEAREARVPERLTNDRHALYALSISADASVVAAARATFTNPGDIHVYSANAATPGYSDVRLTDVNPWLRNRAVVTPEEFWTEGPDGDEVHGWVMKPASPGPGARAPLVLEIHGGPHAAYGYAFFHEFQVLCGEGIGVLFTNPPGSTGYGQDFTAATHHDWGGRDFRALMAAVDKVAGLEWVDGDRLGVTGGSFGGYMTNWMITQTDRFAAAVTQRSTCNRYSQFGTSDIGYYMGDFEFRGNPWDEQEFYLSRSPISHVSNVVTPLLLIHSENDLRCPVEQAEQFYTALRWLGRTAELVRFPDEHHELSRSGQPIHRVERLERIAGWFVRHLVRR